MAGRLGKGVQFMRTLEQKAQQSTQTRRLRRRRTSQDHPRRLRGPDQGIAEPILLGDRSDRCRVHKNSASTLSRPSSIRPRPTSARPTPTLSTNGAKRQGITQTRASELMRQANYFGPMMVEQGDADAFVSGLTYNYPEVLRPALQVVGAPEGRWVSGVYLMLVQDQLYFFTDATVIIDPSAEQLAAIALNAADFAERFDIEPRVAMLSFSNFGSVDHARDAQGCRGDHDWSRNCAPIFRSTARCRPTWPWCPN